MVGMEEETLPDFRSVDDEQEVRQERRLCFVGVCRAEESLVLTRAKTIKGYGIASAESRNPTHQEKKLTDQALAAFKERFEIPIPAKEAKDGTPYCPSKDSPEIIYIQERRRELGGSMPRRASPSISS